MSRFKAVFCLLPRRLARHTPESKNIWDLPNMEFIGWVWLRKVNLVNNLTHGWIAFQDDNPHLRTSSGLKGAA